MCQLNLQDDTRDVALGTNAVSGVEWDGDNEKSFTIRYKGGDQDDKKTERYTCTIGQFVIASKRTC